MAIELSAVTYGWTEQVLTGEDKREFSRVMEMFNILNSVSVMQEICIYQNSLHSAFDICAFHYVIYTSILKIGV